MLEIHAPSHKQAHRARPKKNREIFELLSSVPSGIIPPVVDRVPALRPAPVDEGSNG